MSGGGSIYAQKGSTGGSVYAGSGSRSGGSVYAGGTSAVPKPKKSGGGFLQDLEKYSGAQLVGNLASDIGSTAVGVGPGLYKAGKAGYENVRHPLRGQNLSLNPDPRKYHPGGKNASPFEKAVVAPTVQQYRDYYGRNVFEHLYQHPLQPILDALTVATGGAGAAAKVGKVAADAGAISDTSRLARLGERATVTTRSPRKIATGIGPSHVDITSAQPLVKGRELVAAKTRAAHPEGVARVGGELRRFGKQIQATANQHALSHLTAFEPYAKATRRLSPDEWTALHLRAIDIHPDDLAQLWKGTPAEQIATDPTVRRLTLSPSKRMLAAEPQARALSTEGEQLYRGKRLLKEETAKARAGLTQKQAGELLGRPVKTITGDPYYFPHTIEPPKGVSPLKAGGGGKGVPRKLGSMKQNQGVLALTGRLHLRSDVLGPEFLRRVKYVKYDEIHNALVRGAVRVTHQQIVDQFGGKLPKGWEYIRTKPAKVERTVSAEPNANQLLIPGTHGATRTETVNVGGRSVPATIRNEGTQHIPIHQLIPSPEDLHSSPLAEGFSTTDPAVAHTSGGRYYIVPKQTVKAATGEFTRSSDFTRAFVKRPLTVWRSAVLGLRVGFLTNNLIGNSLMYAVKTGGQGAIRDLFGAIMETHGPKVARRILDDPATPPKLRVDLYKQYFPEQIHGTFGRTQSPATSAAHLAGQKTAEAARTVTGALPRLTSKVAEEIPRKALIRHYIRNSPEFKNVYRALPKQTRTFEQAARKVLDGQGAAYQRAISKQVNQALGDYLNLSPAERNVIRNTLPFYSWYRAIATTTYHLAVDTPLRATLLAQIGRIGAVSSQQALGAVPSFLRGAIPLGHGPQGTERVLSTQGLNPYATLEQLRRGGLTDISSLGLNPFVEGPLQYAQRAQGNISPLALLLSPLRDLALNLPPSRLIAPPGPSKLYPTRKGIRPQLLGYAGLPVKEYSPTVAAQQAKKGR